MLRRWATIMAGTLTVLAIAAVGALWLEQMLEDRRTALPGARHAALHVGCPPGSHGTPRYAKFGRSLGFGPDGGRATPVRDRGVTAEIPARNSSRP